MLELSVPFCLFNRICVIEENGKNVRFGLVDAADEQLKKQVCRWAGRKDREICCSFEKISEEELRKNISFKYGVARSKDGIDEKSDQKKEEDAQNAARLLLNSIFDQARRKGATDIHIDERSVRFRVNGALERVCGLSREKSDELVRRIKVLSRLDVLERRKAQDGQFAHCESDGKNPVFVRVSCVPSVSELGNSIDSETVVLRLLDVSRVPLKLDSLGFDEEQMQQLDSLVECSNGLVLVCGATGSGKSTTAASMLARLNERFEGRKKIISIEDPPEYVMDGVSQIRVDDQFGLSFAEALRFIFRQDPDVLFIGEIRDETTAMTVVQAALTGHLVFATLHTSGIYETGKRMKQLGVDFEVFSSALRGIIFQQLDFDEGKAKLKAEIYRNTSRRRNEQAFLERAV